MRILTYKRTHKGDPNPNGQFGVNDCMGRVRNWNFDAVIGIGSLAPWSDSTDIAGKLTWVGAHPFRSSSPNERGDILLFKHFILLDDDGPLFENEAPLLAKRFFTKNARCILNSYSSSEKAEALALVKKYLNDAFIHSHDYQLSTCKKRKCPPRIPKKRCSDI